MAAISERFGKQNGVQLRHFIVSFAPSELEDPAIVNEIAEQAAIYVGQKYQVLYAIHEDKPHLHFYLVHNSVSYLDGTHYYESKQEFYAFQKVLKAILRQHGIYWLEYISSKTRGQNEDEACEALRVKDCFL